VEVDIENIFNNEDLVDFIVCWDCGEKFEEDETYEGSFCPYCLEHI